jgi:glycosyltransferase involved in cell wall biosynthesis
MRVAIVDHRVSAGGVSRFLCALSTHIALLYSDDDFVLFSSREVIARDGLRDAFAAVPNVDVRVLPQPSDISSAAEEEAIARGRSARRRRFVDLVKRNRLVFDLALRMYRWWREGVRHDRKPWYRFSFTPEAVRELDAFDVVYFAWPFFMEPASFRPPVVGTFHDLHFKHFPDAYNPEMLRILESQMGYWLGAMSEVVVSTKYIAGELERNYPGSASAVDVVYLAPYAPERLGSEEIGAVRDAHGVPRRYLIYSGGRPRHKNIIALLKALTHLRGSGEDIPLVITGIGTEVIGDENTSLPEADAAYELNEYLRCSDLRLGIDVMPLGYVSNRDVDALTQGATVLVSASLYEAGCGPANDAWQAGVPVAFSRIAPFTEQLEVMGVKAWMFDPDDPRDIADKILEILGDPQAVARVTAESRARLGEYTWDDVATGYHRVFESAVASRTPAGGRP